MTVRQYIRTDSGPPPNTELPAVLPTPDLVWRGDGIVLAVPSLTVYTTGAELLILGRTATGPVRDVEQLRATSAALRGLKVNGHPVQVTRGELAERGFTHHAWIAFQQGSHDDLVFTLDWPGIETADHAVSGEQVREAAARAEVLWS